MASTRGDDAALTHLRHCRPVMRESHARSPSAVPASHVCRPTATSEEKPAPVQMQLFRFLFVRAAEQAYLLKWVAGGRLMQVGGGRDAWE